MSMNSKRPFAGQFALDPLEPRLALAADVTLSLGALSNPFDRRQDSDMIRVPVIVENVGDAPARGGATVEFYLSEDQTLNDADSLFATRRINRLPGPGGRTTIRLDEKEPNLVNPPAPARHLSPGDYFLLARLVTDRPDADANPENNTGASAETVNLSYDFGFNGQRHRVLKWTEPDGSEVTVRMDRVGQGNLDWTPNGIVLVVTFAERNASLVISTTGRNPLRFSQIILPQGIKEVRAPRVALTGLVNVEGPAWRFALGSLVNGSLSISAPFGQHVLIEIGEVRDAVITSNVGIESLSVGSWRDTDASPDFLRAPFARGISSSGDFAPGVTINSVSPSRKSIEQFRAHGAVGGVWSVFGDVDLWEAGSTGASFRANFNQVIEVFRTRGEMRGLVAASLLGRLEVGGDLISARVLAGYGLGQDVEVGGTGASADQFRNGPLESATIRGRMINSIVASGLRSTDAVLLDDDDTLITTPAGARIGSIVVGRTMTNSFFVAPAIPAQASIAWRTIGTEGDNRFVTQLPLPEGIRFDPNAPSPSPPAGGGGGGGSGSNGNGASAALAFLRRRR
jgi:hypothetical protein